MIFFKKTIIKSGILVDMCDCHSHILPNVDDGVRSVEEAIAILDSYQALGVRRVVFTPHIMEDYPQNTAQFLRLKFDEFKRLYTGEVELALGAEYMLDAKFEKHLNSGDLLTIVNNYLLIETSYVNSPINFIAQLKAIQSKGYFVVLAHPERYTYMKDDDYKQLKNIGILFQLNLLSIVGVYGKLVEQKAKILLHSGCYDLLGTDIHNLKFHLNIFHHHKLSRKDISVILRLKNI